MKEQLIVARYGEPDSIRTASFGEWWLETERWAEMLGVSPNEVAARYKAKPKGLVSSNGYCLTRYRDRVEREVDAGNIEELALTRLARKCQFKALDWEFHADHGRFDKDFAVLSSGISLGALYRLPDMSPDGFVQSALRQGLPFLDAVYGFAIILPKCWVPACYVLGVASGEMPQEMVSDTNAWRQFSARECGWTLRNVYGYNLLNRKHLDIDVGGQRLEDWIRSSPARGWLEPHESGLSIWTFQEGSDQEAFLRWDYPAVVRVREALKKHRVLSWQSLSGVE